MNDYLNVATGETYTLSEKQIAADAALEVENAKIRAEVYAKLTYDVKRAMEYPPIIDYVDGVVKGDQAQIDAYIAACLAVKAKHPKS